jgi:hypothetical protein
MPSADSWTNSHLVRRIREKDVLSTSWHAPKANAIDTRPAKLNRIRAPLPAHVSVERALPLFFEEGRQIVDSQTLMLVGIAVAMLILIAAVWMYSVRQRRERLRERFGPEYDRTVRAVGRPDKAESILKERADRVDRFKLRPLSSSQVDEFDREWRRVQATFVDDPAGAAASADALVSQVMVARGYPPEDFDRRAEDVSVDHPHVVENYRIARELMQRRERGEAGTEELRRAIVNYRALFADLLEVEPKERERRRAS